VPAFTLTEKVTACQHNTRSSHTCQKQHQDRNAGEAGTYQGHCCHSQRHKEIRNHPRSLSGTFRRLPEAPAQARAGGDSTAGGQSPAQTGLTSVPRKSHDTRHTSGRAPSQLSLSLCCFNWGCQARCKQTRMRPCTACRAFSAARDAGLTAPCSLQSARALHTVELGAGPSPAAIKLATQLIWTDLN